MLVMATQSLSPIHPQPLSPSLSSSSSSSSSPSSSSSSNPRVYVGNISYSTSWQDLKDFVREHTGVHEAHVEILQAPTGRSKGCAVVTFPSAAEAARAIAILNGLELGSRRLFVREDRETHAASSSSHSSSSSSSHARGGGYQQQYPSSSGYRGEAVGVFHQARSFDPNAKRGPSIFDHLAPRGGGGAGAAAASAYHPSSSYSSSHQQQQRDPYAARSHQPHQLYAPRSVLPPQHHEDGMMEREAFWDESTGLQPAQGVPFHSSPPRIANTGSSLFVGGLPFSTTSQVLQDLFSDVIHAEVICHPQSSRSRGFGTVKFASAEAAQAAMNALNGSELEGRRILVKLDQNPRI